MTDRRFQEDLKSLTRYAEDADGNRIPLPALDPASPIPSARGMAVKISGAAGGDTTDWTETAIGDRTYWAERTITSSDGVINMKIKPLKTAKFSDGAGNFLTIEFADPGP